MGTQVPPQPLLDVQQVADQLHIPVRGVYVLVESGLLGYYRVGRRLRFDSEHVAAYLHANSREAAR